MFKIAVLQRMYHFSDPQTEYQIRDRLSFCDFLGLVSDDKVPDEKTIWAFKEKLTKKGLIKRLFNKFYAFLEENKQIKEDKGGESWNPEDGDTEEEKKRKANKSKLIQT